MSTDYTVKPDLGELAQSEFFDLKTPPFDVQKHCLYSVVSGSKAYGIDTPNSDTDVRGVVAVPERFLLGLGKCEQIENQSKDICYYSLRRLFELALKNNVHAMELLWMPERTVKFVHPVFKYVLDAREMFLSKRIGYTCGGYAFQQVKLSFVKKANNTGRQHLIEAFGYDCKMLGHALRIYRMGREVLLTGHLNVYRPDREFLLEVRNGKYPLEQLAVMGKDEKGRDTIVGGLLADEMRLFDEALERSTLPSAPRFEPVEQLLIGVQKTLLSMPEFSD